jgi:heme-degrading monooxygenase HmoA
MLEIAVEIVIFRLLEGVSENEFLAASNIMMKELGSLDGFIDRELLKKDDGSWMDLLHWENMDAATKAVKAALKLPLCLEYFKLIDEVMSHYGLFQSFEA